MPGELGTLLRKLSNYHTRLCLIALVFALAPHYDRVSYLLLIFCVSTWSYAWVAEQRYIPRLSKPIRFLVTIAGLICLLTTHPNLLDRDTFVALLVTLAGLKVLEINGHRDKVICTFIAYFLVMTCLLYEDNLVMSLYLFSSVFLSTAVLVAINYSEVFVRDICKITWKVIAISIPFTIILFVGFPRYRGGFFGFTDTNKGFTGFSDRLSPGTVTNLIASKKTAFRVEFDAKIPRLEDLYFRGIVFYRFDGSNWHRGLPVQENSKRIRGEKKSSYHIILEPHNEKWLFSLDYPRHAPNKSRLLADFSIKTKERITSKIRYSLSSVMSKNIDSDPILLNRSLQLPKTRNPRTTRLANFFKKESKSNEEIVKKAFSYFKDNDFKYSKRPPRLDKKDSIDQFIFETKRGYCEHYASSFAFILRAAGIPTRIVGGYLGGQRNPMGDYLIVRQKDAHAWVEVWLDKQGWFRIDPTAAVAPERINRGADQIFDSEKEKRVRAINDESLLRSSIKKALLAWDAVNFYWNNWIMGYSKSQQKKFLKKLGIENYTTKKLLIYTLGLTSILALLMMIPFFRKIKRKNKDLMEVYYEKFLSKLSKQSVIKKQSTGPRSFAIDAIRSLPDKENEILEISKIYIDAKYAGHQNQESLLKMKEKVRSF